MRGIERGPIRYVAGELFLCQRQNAKSTNQHLHGYEGSCGYRWHRSRSGARQNNRGRRVRWLCAGLITCSCTQVMKLPWEEENCSREINLTFSCIYELFLDTLVARIIITIKACDQVRFWRGDAAPRDDFITVAAHDQAMRILARLHLTLRCAARDNCVAVCAIFMPGRDGGNSGVSSLTESPELLCTYRHGHVHREERRTVNRTTTPTRCSFCLRDPLLRKLAGDNLCRDIELTCAAADDAGKA